MKIDKITSTIKKSTSKNKRPDTDESRPNIGTNETRLLKKNVICKSNFVRLSAKNVQRKDEKSRRYGRCASCKHRCGECQSCSSDQKKTKSGCNKRFICLKNSSFVDEPSLLDGMKRQREDETEIDFSSSKGVKLSENVEDKSCISPTGRVRQPAGE